MAGYSIDYEKGGQVYNIFKSGYSGYTIHSGTYHRERNTCGTLSFTVDPSCPAYNELAEFSGIVNLKFNDDVLFLARIFSITTHMDGTKDVECEGLLAYLNDSVIPPYVFDKDYHIGGKRDKGVTPTLKKFIEDLLDYHNSQMTADQCIYLSEFYSDAELLEKYVIYENTAFSSAWGELADKVLEPYGAIVNYWYNDQTLQREIAIAKASSAATNPVQTLKRGVNLKDYSVYKDFLELATGLYPLSHYYDDNGVSHTIDISSYTGGTKFITTGAANTYGRINRLVEYDGITNAETLYAAANSRLNLTTSPPPVVNIEMIDLCALGKANVPLRIENYVKIEDPKLVSLIGKDKLPLIAFDVDLKDPTNGSYTFNANQKSYVAKY